MDNNTCHRHFYPTIPKTKTLRTEKQIDAPANVVWGVVGNFSRFDRFTDGLNKCQMIGEGLGQVRVKAFDSGDYVVDQISFRDDRNMQMQFNIISTSLNIRSLWEFMSVEKLSRSRCKVIWEMAAEPKKGLQEELEVFLSGFARAALNNVENICCEKVNEVYP
ncbi:SRPBCC family protein [Vibrio splendidus]|uniref:SRPBCC family protein n=1 Tax=Vibrio splendidus TaxID=29497 RepID=UPI002468A6E3|nr:SRPBCC family protein [Vibrio splendidus]MDH5917977.1 SRPBCC family protein [Vibrio splendidus]